MLPVLGAGYSGLWPADLRLPAWPDSPTPAPSFLSAGGGGDKVW